MSGAKTRYLWPPVGRVHIARNKKVSLCGVSPSVPWVGDMRPPEYYLCRRCLRSEATK